MKKRIIILSVAITALGIAAFGIIRNNAASGDLGFTSIETTATDAEVVYPSSKPKSDFNLAVGTRFNSIKKGDLDKLRSFDDYIGEEHAQTIVSYKSVSIFVLEDSEKTDIKETGNSGVFTANQLQLLQSVDYSTNLLIWADYREKIRETGEVADGHWTPHLTVVPEKQAVYETGNEALVEYLRVHSEEKTANIAVDKLKPGKLYFKVTKDGTISDAKVTTSSGYSEIDEKMIELIINSPGAWEPAQNSKGEKVDQMLVISFGSMGC